MTEIMTEYTNKSTWYFAPSMYFTFSFFMQEIMHILLTLTIRKCVESSKFVIIRSHISEKMRAIKGNCKKTNLVEVFLLNWIKNNYWAFFHVAPKIPDENMCWLLFHNGCLILFGGGPGGHILAYQFNFCHSSNKFSFFFTFYVYSISNLGFIFNIHVYCKIKR